MIDDKNKEVERIANDEDAEPELRLYREGEDLPEWDNDDEFDPFESLPEEL